MPFQIGSMARPSYDSVLCPGDECFSSLWIRHSHRATFAHYCRYNKVQNSSTKTSKHDIVETWCFFAQTHLLFTESDILVMNDGCGRCTVLGLLLFHNDGIGFHYLCCRLGSHNRDSWLGGHNRDSWLGSHNRDSWLGGSYNSRLSNRLGGSYNYSRLVNRLRKLCKLQACP